MKMPEMKADETPSENQMTDKAKMPKLKPCPFCGGEAALEKKHGTTSRVTFAVGCLDESCIGFPSITFQLRSDAVAAWNRRAS